MDFVSFSVKGVSFHFRLVLTALDSSKFPLFVTLVVSDMVIMGKTFNDLREAWCESKENGSVLKKIYKDGVPWGGGNL